MSSKKRFVRLVVALLVVGSISYGETGDYYARSKWGFKSLLDSGELTLSILLISVEYSGGIIDPPDDYDAQDRDMEKTNQRMRESSYNQAWYNWAIYPGKDEDPLIVDGSAVVGDNGKISGWQGQYSLFQAAMSAARDRYGSDVFSGNRHIYGRIKGKQGSAFPTTQYAFGNAGGGAQWHELIHNLAFNHGSDLTTPITLAGGGSFNAPMRAVKGWIRENEGYFRVTQSGVYRLYDLDSPELLEDKNFACVIERFVEDSSGVRAQAADLWIEYRPNPPAKQHETLTRGVRLINYGTLGESNAGRTIDATPDNGVDPDHALTIGSSWIDEDNKVKGEEIVGTQAIITPLQVNDTEPGSIDIRIELPEDITVARAKTDRREIARAVIGKHAGSIEVSIPSDGPRHAVPLNVYGVNGRLIAVVSGERMGSITRYEVPLNTLKAGAVYMLCRGEHTLRYVHR